MERKDNTWKAARQKGRRVCPQDLYLNRTLKSRGGSEWSLLRSVAFAFSSALQGVVQLSFTWFPLVINIRYGHMTESKATRRGVMSGLLKSALTPLGRFSTNREPL